MITIYEEVFGNPDKKPFRELSAEELKIVVSAPSTLGHVLEYWSGMYIGNSESWTWEEMCNPSHSGQMYYDNGVYRVMRNVEVKSLVIPWVLIDDKWQYAAMDENGIIWFFDEMPYTDLDESSSEWLCPFDADFTRNPLKIATEGVHWKYSLTKRP